jgi:hypothetical protein
VKDVPADDSTTTDGSMDDRNDLIQLRLESRVKVLGSSDGDQTVFVGQLGEHADLIVTLELNSKSHGDCFSNVSNCYQRVIKRERAREGLNQKDK